MEEFKKYKFGDIVNILDSKRIPLSATQRENRKGIYPYYGAQGIIDYIDDYIFDGTYLLIAEDGENLKSQKNNIAQIAIGKYWVNNHAHIVESNGSCDIRYICYLLNKIDISGYITGSAQPKLNQANLQSIELSLPSLTVQKRIADYIDLFDSKISLNRRINDNLEQQAQAMFKSWFVENASYSGVSISEYFLPNRGKNLLVSDAKGGKTPVVAGGLTPSAFHNVANTKAPVITISASGANAGFVNLWGIPVWAADSSYIDSTIVSNIYFWYNLLKYNQKNIYESQTGSAQPHIYPKHIGNLLIPDLDMRKVECYESIVTSMYLQINEIQQETKFLSDLRDTLLPKLISGELKINDLNC